jgi:hypothetical protein
MYICPVYKKGIEMPIKVVHKLIYSIVHDITV